MAETTSRKILPPLDLPEALRGSTLAMSLVRASTWLNAFAEDQDYPATMAPLVELLRLAGEDFAALEDEHLGLIDRHDALLAEVERLRGWLAKIDGGDSPCTDESRLRQWAYEAGTLGREAPRD